MSNKPKTVRFLTGLAVGLIGLAVSSTSNAAEIIAELEVLSPTPTVFTFEQRPVDGTSTGDFTWMTSAGLGAAIGGVTAIDLALGGTEASSTSGCEASDFTGFTSGNIALIQRGACLFSTKAQNAFDAGAIGVLIFNQGDDPSRTGLVNSTLGSLFTTPIPVLFTTYDVGVTLAGMTNPQLRMLIETVPAPAALGFLGLGLAGLGFARRRRSA